MALQVAKLKSCLKRPNSKRKPINSVDDCYTNGYLGLGRRYRLGETSFTLYNTCGPEEVDEGESSAPDSRDSLRHTISSAAHFIGEPSLARPRRHNGTIKPPSDGVRYWFGMARGLRKAKQLLIDLDDEKHSRLGWPIVWTRKGAFLFLDQEDTNTEYYDFLPRTGVPDYCFLKLADARRLVELDLCKYDHLGEIVDIPVWEATSLAGNDARLLALLEITEIMLTPFIHILAAPARPLEEMHFMMDLNLKTKKDVTLMSMRG